MILWSDNMDGAREYAIKTGKPILAYVVQNPKNCGCGEGGRLCLYHAHADGLYSTQTGYHVLEWGGAWDDSSYEYPDGANLPDWWFRTDSEFECAAYPVAWARIDEPVVMIRKAEEA